MQMDAGKNSIAEFFSREYHALAHFVRRWLDDEAGREAEDIVQDVLLSIVDRADVTAPIADLSAYVYAALKNKIKDAYRAARTRGVREGSDSLANLIQEQYPDAAHAAERAELSERLYAAIATLAADERALISANEFAGVPFRELAEEWQVPIGTLLARKSRALAKIRRLLAPSIATGG
jgi:RNA polymerase sigma factor (sigma-70 family)